MLEIFIKNVRELDVLFPLDILLVNGSRLNNVLWNELEVDGVPRADRGMNCRPCLEGFTDLLPADAVPSPRLTHINHLN
jgi:hypothetical protein